MAWRGLARQNALAAKLLCERAPRLACPIVSRLYYSLHQAAVAKLIEAGEVRAKWEHSEVWNEADLKLRPGIGTQLATLYDWRVKADYAKGRVTEKQATQFAAIVIPMVVELGVDLEAAA